MTEQRKVVVPSPENSETPLADAQSWVTPNRPFFVRNHFDVPRPFPKSIPYSSGSKSVRSK
jgi:hypothetical protein